ncbi:putative dihydroorotate oxidase [Phialemonium atrogriseum]|uniref:Dihydroorotate dehydrogenase (fumarate) n=1 Tax=Phialemonium atrogriseum TaxID=1093897 RepID=A0AAJ0C8Z3_9PEZI|nr:putative dihydroorotate oxidase [Phialemonium atrogriseum]KAK1771153.1 putative dihydroorotate oxidase [Phialemonium atrogriseum]
MAQSQPPVLDLQPPLLNSANPWATTLEDLRALYYCTSTGAVTTRTSLIQGFAHDSAIHQHLFFTTGHHSVARDRDLLSGPENASLNTLGYSPISLDGYLGFIRTIASSQSPAPPPGKYFIISVTGSPEEVAECYKVIASAKRDIPTPLAVEINLSCPNIPGAPPPAYSGMALAKYLTVLSSLIASNPDLPRLPFGLKTPPYTHAAEYQTLIDALLDSTAGGAEGTSPLSFITATNTLGSCLVLSSGDGGGDDPASPTPSLPGAGIGGMAGAPLHPLALGNVATIRRMLDEHPGALGHVRVVGVGGVLDAGGYRRMRAAGAAAVGVGTGLGLRGVGIFREIERGLGGKWK